MLRYDEEKCVEALCLILWTASKGITDLWKILEEYGIKDLLRNAVNVAETLRNAQEIWRPSGRISYGVSTVHIFFGLREDEKCARNSCQPIGSSEELPDPLPTVSLCNRHFLPRFLKGIVLRKLRGGGVIKDAF
jgi:hypothetical protein